MVFLYTTDRIKMGWHEFKDVDFFCNKFSDDLYNKRVLGVLQCLPENLKLSSFANGSERGDDMENNYRGVWTKEVKTRIAIQGLKEKYKCYSGQLSEEYVEARVEELIKIGELDHNSVDMSCFRNCEWLYDLIWYKESDAECYMITDFELAMESEWSYDRNEAKIKGVPYAAVKYDFQKLVVSTARINVLIFRERNGMRVVWPLTEFSKYVENQLMYAKGFGRFFLFVAYNTNMESFKFSLYKT